MLLNPNPFREGADSVNKEIYLIAGLFTICFAFPILFMGVLALILFAIEGETVGAFIGFMLIMLALCAVVAGVCLLIIHRLNNKVKESSIFLDADIIAYKIDYETRSHNLGGPAHRLICRCHFTDGAYRDFLSHPIWADPNIYMGKKVRIYSKTQDFYSYVIDLDNVR